MNLKRSTSTLYKEGIRERVRTSLSLLSIKHDIVLKRYLLPWQSALFGSVQTYKTENIPVKRTDGHSPQRTPDHYQDKEVTGLPSRMQYTLAVPIPSLAESLFHLHRAGKYMITYRTTLQWSVTNKMTGTQ